jgi:predicted RecB family endonuclease
MPSFELTPCAHRVIMSPEGRRCTSDSPSRNSTFVTSLKCQTRRPDRATDHGRPAPGARRVGDRLRSWAAACRWIACVACSQ